MKNYTSYTPTSSPRTAKKTTLRTPRSALAEAAQAAEDLKKSSKASPKPLRREKHNRPRNTYQKPKSLTFPIMCAIMVVWGLIVLGLATLQAISGSTGEASSKNGKTPTSSTTEAENLLPNRFFDENGLSRAENREVITLAAEVVKLIEERGFMVGEVIVPKGYLREFDLVMNREATDSKAPDSDLSSTTPPLAVSVRIRCSTARLASVTATDAIHVYDLWLDGELAASQYIDIRTPRRAFSL